MAIRSILPVTGNMKDWMGRPWKQLTRRSRISQRISFLFKRRPSLPAHYQRYRSTYCGSSGQTHTGADHVLFELEGTLSPLYQFRATHLGG